MTKNSPTRSAEIRARIGHPIIDSDGHVVEFEPALLDYIRDTGGTKLLESYKTAWDTAFYFHWNHITPQERRLEFLHFTTQFCAYVERSTAQAGLFCSGTGFPACHSLIQSHR
jgi:hypothetical protein